MKPKWDKWLHHIDRLDLANRPKQLWTLAILFAVLLNLLLFLGITFLTGVPTEMPSEDFRMTNAIRLMGSMGAEKKKEPIPEEPEKPTPEIKPEKITPEVKEELVVSPVPTPISVPAATPETTSDASENALSSGAGTNSGSSGSGIYDSGDLDGVLVPISRKPPVYPGEARRKEIEGAVRVRIVVDERGRVESAQIVWAKPEGVFEKNALACAKEWRFQPPRKNGKPVKARAESTLRFNLEE